MYKFYIPLIKLYTQEMDKSAIIIRTPHFDVIILVRRETLDKCNLREKMSIAERVK